MTSSPVTLDPPDSPLAPREEPPATLLEHGGREDRLVFGIALAAALAVHAVAGESAFSAPTQVMDAIAEALDATAIGLAVAIPAVAMYNYFHRLSRSILANTDALSHVLLSHLVADPVRNDARATGNAE